MRVEVFERTGRGRVRPVRVATCADDRRRVAPETPQAAAARLVRVEGLVERAAEIVYERLQLHRPEDCRHAFWLEVLRILCRRQRSARCRVA